MHTKLTVYWDNDDPHDFAKQVEEAFNRMANWCAELYPQRTALGKTCFDKKEKSRELTAFNRVTNGEFDLEDLGVLMKYAQTICRNAVGKYGHDEREVVREAEGEHGRDEPGEYDV